MRLYRNRDVHTLVCFLDELAARQYKTETINNNLVSSTSYYVFIKILKRILTDAANFLTENTLGNSPFSCRLIRKICFAPNDKNVYVTTNYFKYFKNVKKSSYYTLSFELHIKNFYNKELLVNNYTDRLNKAYRIFFGTIDDIFAVNDTNTYFISQYREV